MILRNLPILREKLPEILLQSECNEFHEKAQEIYDIISVSISTCIILRAAEFYLYSLDYICLIWFTPCSV